MFPCPSGAINVKDMGTSLQFARGNTGAPGVEVNTGVRNVGIVYRINAVTVGGSTELWAL